MEQPTITRTTTGVAVGQPISGMYTDQGGMCLDPSGTITQAERDGNKYRITVEFSNGIVRDYSNVEPSGESDFTLALGTCDGCGKHDSVGWLHYWHTCP